MTNWLNHLIHSQTITPNSSQAWQHLLWREWRNCEDEEYAFHLFALVVDEPADGWAVAMLGLWGSLYGILGGWLINVVRYWPETSIGLASRDVTIGALVGGIAGLLLALGFKRRSRLSWGIWLQGLIPTVPLIALPKLLQLPLFYKLVISLGSGLGVGLAGATFFGQPNPHFFSLLTSLVIVTGIGFHYRRAVVLIETLIFGLAGLFFGLLFGLGFAQLIGQVAGPFDVNASARLVGVGVGLGAGFFLGQGSGLVGGLIWLSLMTGLIWLTGPNLPLTTWLVGLLIGGAAGSISRMVSLAPSKMSFDQLYRYRHWFLWWIGRPAAAQVETTLRQRATSQVWLEPLRRLTAQQQQLDTAENLWSYLRRPYWVERFVGRQALVTLGSEGIPHLRPVVEIPTHPLRRIAVWLIRSIGIETSTRLTDQASTTICPNCLTGCGPHQVHLSRLPITYYGCRTCRQSRDLLNCSQGVVAVLNADWKQERRYQAGLLRINWLKWRALFDFTEVEIIKATDEDVERLAMQIGNDTDPTRRSRYAGMSCFVAPECHLSENTWRILQRTFGGVQQEKSRPSDKRGS